MERAAGDDSSDLTVLGVGFNDLGKLLKYVMTASVVGFVTAMVGMVVLLLAVADEPFVDEPTVQAEPFNAAFLLVSLLGLSFVTLMLSCFAYSGWSIRQAQRLRQETGRQSAFRRPRRLHTILSADSETLDEYERRVELAAGAFLLGVFLLFILGHSLVASGLRPGDLSVL